MKTLMGLAGLTMAGFMLLSCNTEVKEANYQIIPLPQEISVMDQAAPFILSNGTKIMYPEGNEKMQKNAEFLASYIKDLTGKSLAVQAGTDGKGIILQLGGNAENPEGYQLKVTSDQVVISGPTEAGVFYGIQTLRKSIPVAQGVDIALPAVEINDYPRFSYRGAMLDVSRHFFPVDSVKRFIDMLALHNINRFHWHLSEDQGWRIEIKSRPELTEIGSKRAETVIGHNSGKYDGKPYGGFFTQEEAKEIVAYAAERHITVIPEIDMPGHMQAALAAYPNLGCTGGPYEVWKIWGVSEDVLCAGNDETLKFIEDVLGEIIQIFPSEYIHVGGDECPKTAWEQCEHCQKLIRELGLENDITPNPVDGRKHTKEEKLQSYIVSRVEKYLNSKGRNIIGWDEILEGGLAPNATVMSWRGVEGGMTAAKAGHDAIMTPNPYAYLDHYQEEPEIAPVTIGGYNTLKKTYSYNPVPADADSLVKQHIIGVQANCWAEYMPTEDNRDYQIFPRLIAISETGWTPMKKKNFTSFCNRMVEDFQRLEAMGVKPCLNFFDVNINTRATQEGVLNVELETFYPGAQIYYTTHGEQPSIHANLYNHPFPLDGTYDLKAAAFVNGKQIGKVTHKQLYKNLISGKKYEIMPEPKGMKGDILGENDILGADTVTLGLTNGKRGNNASSTPWVGISPDNNDKVTFIVDFEKATIRKIRFGTLYNAAGGILPVSKAVVYVSSLDNKFEKVAEKEFTYDIKENTFRGFDEEIEFPAQEAVKVKIEFTSGGKIRNGIDCYSPHDKSEVPSTMALDEIEIY